MATTVTLDGKRFVILPEAEYLLLRNVLAPESEPPLPAPDENGNYPAIETGRALLARKISAHRRGLGWSQAELARRAGVRIQTIKRLEEGKHSPSVRAVDKLERVFDAAAAKRPQRKRRK